MESRTESITPKKAAEMLSLNTNNRPLKQSHVNMLAAAMSSGEWKLNGESIKFSSDGCLIDGQHRLAAIIQSGITILVYVVRGLEPSAYDTIDQGKSRSICDVFARRGEKNYVALSVAVRWVWMLTSDAPLMSLKPTKLRPEVANAILEKHAGITDSISFCVGSGIEKLMSVGMASALHYLCSQLDADLASTFWGRLIDGQELTKEMPVYLLRERLAGNRNDIAKLRQEMIVALCIKAWNATRAGKKLGVLKLGDKEDFPKIV